MQVVKWGKRKMAIRLYKDGKAKLYATAAYAPKVWDQKGPRLVSSGLFMLSVYADVVGFTRAEAEDAEVTRMLLKRLQVTNTTSEEEQQKLLLILMDAAALQYEIVEYVLGKEITTRKPVRQKESKNGI